MGPSPVAAETWFRIVSLGLSSSDPPTIRSCLSAAVDFIFFNRAVSGHLLQPGDLRVQNSQVVFRERATKTHRTKEPGHRVRTFNAAGVPALLDLIRHWEAVLQHKWTTQNSSPTHYWILPCESQPHARTISTWFSALLTTHPELSPTPHRHHDLRSGGASSCFALEVPEAHIRAWGDWSGSGRSFWRYVNVDRQPTEWDYRIFGWMTIRARDLHARFAALFLPPVAARVRGQFYERSWSEGRQQ